METNHTAIVSNHSSNARNSGCVSLLFTLATLGEPNKVTKVLANQYKSIAATLLFPPAPREEYIHV